MNATFGLAHIKKEGAAMHPDDIECDLSDEQYVKQAREYIAATGDVVAVFARVKEYDELGPVFASVRSENDHPAQAKTNTSGLAPVEYKILIQPESVEETDDVLKSARAAGIALPDKATDRERMAQVRGTLIAIGGNAFTDWHEPLPKVGDRIYYAKYSGIVIKGEDGKEYRLANDKDVSAIVEVAK